MSRSIKHDPPSIARRYGIYHPVHPQQKPPPPVDFDGHNAWAKRFRTVLRRQLTDLGGEDNCSHAEQALAQRASCLIVELELLEGRFAKAGGAKNWELLEYGRATNTLARTLKLLGLKRRPKDVTALEPLEYARQRVQEAAE